MTGGGGGGGAGVPFVCGLPNFFLFFAPPFKGGRAACIVGLRVEKLEFGVEAECGGEEILESGEDERLSLGLLEDAVDISRSLEGSLEWDWEDPRGMACVKSVSVRVLICVDYTYMAECRG